MSDARVVELADRDPRVGVKLRLALTDIDQARNNLLLLLAATELSLACIDTAHSEAVQLSAVADIFAAIEGSLQ